MKSERQSVAALFFTFYSSLFTKENLCAELLVTLETSNAGGVVTAILQFAQAVNDQWHNLLVSNVANNSAHMFSLVKGEK